MIRIKEAFDSLNDDNEHNAINIKVRNHTNSPALTIIVFVRVQRLRNMSSYDRSKDVSRFSEGLASR